MVYGFARQSGGFALIDSIVGEGTTVSVYLPRHDGEAVEEGWVADSYRDPTNFGDGETILVVDDEASIRSLMGEMLEELGYIVLQASDGPAALDMLQANPSIALLITDVGLPGGLNGRQVADLARTQRPGLSVLLVTGYAEQAVLDHGQLPAGMQVMLKPFDFGDFCDRVQALLDTAGGRDSH